MNYKKIIAAAMALSMAVSLTACDSSEGGADETTTADVTTTVCSYGINICLTFLCSFICEGCGCTTCGFTHI